MVTVAEIIESGKTHIEYCQSTKEWLLGRPDGKMLAFPAGDEGKRAAQLSALTHDCPSAASWVEALMQAYPGNLPLHKRLLSAGFLIRDGKVYHLAVSPLGGSYINAYVESATHTGQYHVWYNLTWQCTCEDWQRARDYRFDPHPPAEVVGRIAPTIPGQGIMCKHCLSVFIAAKMQSAQAICPECNGQKWTMTRRSESFWTRDLCELCEGKGQVPAEWVEPLAEEIAPPEQRMGRAEWFDLHGREEEEKESNIILEGLW